LWGRSAQGAHIQAQNNTWILIFFFKAPIIYQRQQEQEEGGGGGGGHGFWGVGFGERVGTFHLRIKLTPPPNKKNCHKKEKNKTKRPSNECPGKWHIVVLNRIFHD
jgi:hypothetical protein